MYPVSQGLSGGVRGHDGYQKNRLDLSFPTMCGMIPQGAWFGVQGAFYNNEAKKGREKGGGRRRGDFYPVLRGLPGVLQGRNGYQKNRLDVSFPTVCGMHPRGAWFDLQNPFLHFFLKK